MSSETRSGVLRAAAVLLIPLIGAGCATKKFVRNDVHDAVAPLETRLGKVDEKTTDNTNQIHELDQKTERAIAEVQGKAEQAQRDATKAGQDAQNASQLAQKGIDQALQVKEELANADKFQPLTTESILFRFNRSDLTDQAKQSLDQLAEKVKTLPHYMIQVQGFTDTTGPAQYNLELSHHRADAVVRYLTLEHKIPLVRIAELGYGEASPVAPNKTRKDREQNRRAEVTVMVPQTVAGTQPSASPAAAALKQP